MGCCETRDEVTANGKVVPATSPKGSRKPHIAKSPSPEADLSQSSSSSLEEIFTDSKHIMKYIEFCKQNKNFPQLVDLVTDSTEISQAPAYIGWAEKPKTIGSLAIVYLCQLIQKDHAKIIPLLGKVLLTFINCIKTGSDDLRDNTMMLLYYALDYMNEDQVLTLLELGIFQLLMRSILCQKSELRHLTAAICGKLYKGRPYAKKIFIDLKGGKQLVQQILWSSESETALNNLLDILIELLLDEEGLPVQDYITKLNEEKALDIICDISSPDKSPETIELIDYLITILSNEEI